MNVSISEKSHRIIRQISESEGIALSEVLDEAVESYRRQKFLSQTNQAFQKLKEDEKISLQHDNAECPPCTHSCFLPFTRYVL